MAGNLDNISLAIAAAIADGKGLHAEARPINPSTGGAYSSSHRFALVASQGANTRLLTLRNAHASNLIVVTSIRLRWLQTANHTAAIEDSLDVYKLTGFSAVDNTGTVTPTISKLKTAYPTASGIVTGVTVAGASGGMTGGTLTKATEPLLQLPQWMIATQATVKFASESLDYAPRVDVGETPLILAPNEGLLIENRVALGAAAGSSVYASITWAEVPSY